MIELHPGDALVVTYHYVRPKVPGEGGIFPIEPHVLAAQIDALAARADIVLPSELSRPCPDRARVALTFDDGTRDHIEYALPVLRAKKAPALFAVMSAPDEEGYVPTFHLVHALVSRVGDRRLWEALTARFDETQLGDPARAAAHYARDTEVRRRVKYALNFALDAETARTFLLEVFRREICLPERFAHAWCLGARDVRSLHAEGMEIAVHAHRHTPLFLPAEEFFAREIAPCAAWVESIIGRAPHQYVAPNGGYSDGGLDVRALETTLRMHGFDQTYLLTRGVNAPPPEFFFRRIDAADLAREGLA